MKEINFENSSGNVFADLGLEDAPGLHARTLLGLKISQFFERMHRDGKSQKEIAEIAGATQPKVSALLNKTYERTSIERMISILSDIGCGVDVLVSQPGEERSPVINVHDKYSYHCLLQDQFRQSLATTKLILGAEPHEQRRAESKTLISSTYPTV